MNTTLLNMVFAGGILAMSILTMTAFRLQLLVRRFMVSALFLSALIAGIGFAHQEEHLYAIAIATLFFKVIVIPMLLRAQARASGTTERLRSYLRPASTYIFAIGVLAFVLLGVQRSPFFGHIDPGYLLSLSVALVLMGFGMMIFRRDIPSQIIGFLVMENGIAVFSYATVSSISIFVELGIFITVTIGVLLMAFLNDSVHHLYGSEDTESLRTLRG